MSIRGLLLLWLLTSVLLFIVVPGAIETAWFWGWRYWNPRSDGVSYALLVDWWAYIPGVWVVAGAFVLLLQWRRQRRLNGDAPAT